MGGGVVPCKQTAFGNQQLANVKSSEFEISSATWLLPALINSLRRFELYNHVGPLQNGP